MLNEKALEAACRAVIDASHTMDGYHQSHVEAVEPTARAAITAYLEALLPADVKEVVDSLAIEITEQRKFGEPIDPSKVSKAAALLQAQAARIAELEAGLEPFSLVAGELFAQNYNDKDVVLSIVGKSDVGGTVKYDITFKAFRRARALSKEGRDHG